MIFDETFELGERPYSVRRLTMGDWLSYLEMAPQPGMAPAEVGQCFMAQLLFLLRGPDGEAPSDEDLRELELVDAIRILDGVTGAPSS